MELQARKVQIAFVWRQQANEEIAPHPKFSLRDWMETSPVINHSNEHHEIASACRYQNTLGKKRINA